MTDLPPHWGPSIRPHQLLTELDRDPALARGFHALGREVNRSDDMRTIELIATAVAAVRMNEYVWRGHCYLAVELLAVLSRDEIARIAHRPDWLPEADRRLVGAVRELLHGDLSPASKALLGARAARFTVAVRFYDLVATLTHDFAPEATTPVVSGLETITIAAHWLGWRDAA